MYAIPYESQHSKYLLTHIDDPEEIHGLPLGIQLVGRRFQEEKVLAMVGRVLETLKYSGWIDAEDKPVHI